MNKGTRSDRKIKSQRIPDTQEQRPQGVSWLRRVTRLPLKTLLGIVIAALLCILILFVFIQLLVASSTLKKTQTELRQLRADTTVFQDGFGRVEQDMNTLQRILSLPESRYLPGEEEPIENASTEFLELFSAIDEIRRLADNEKNFRNFEQILQSPNFISVLNRYSLEGVFTPSGSYELQDEAVTFVSVRFTNEDQVTLTPFFAYINPIETKLQSEILIRAIEALLTRVVAKKHELERTAGFIHERLFEDSIRTLREQQKITIHDSLLTGKGIEILLKKNTQHADSIHISADTLELRYLETEYPSYREFNNAAAQIFSVDIPTFKELETRKLQTLLLEKLNDKGFQIYLEQNDLAMDTRFREEGEFLYLDMISKNDADKVGAISIHIYSNKIWLHDKDDIPLRELRLQELLSQAFVNEEKDADVILLAGSHEDLTDTMILAYATGDGIYLFSIPRDIYYQERKLNAYFRDFGEDRFKKTIETIVGIKINHVVVVDMYAFIELVNTLGGIEVALAQDLIDPSYRVKNGSVWATLYYPEGKHHLNGIEALRIVRSRHTSNDFSRSERQRLVLDAIQTKLETIGLAQLLSSGDSFIRLLSLVTTDMTVLDAIQFGRSYAKKPILGITVLSTKNVLFHTYTSLLNTVPPEQTEAQLEVSTDTEILPQSDTEDSSIEPSGTENESTQKAVALDTSIFATATSLESLALQRVVEPPESLGLWILLPKDNDWSLIRSFIRSEIERVGV